MTTLLGRRAAVLVFLAFAFAYFFSALIRAITATLSPTLAREFGLSASDLGLLAGGYFLGFAAFQLPLGRWLDKYGPKKVILSFLSLAVLGCLAFSWAGSFSGLLAARILCGVGVSACLMAPLTGYRQWFEPAVQLRANSWMLMTGSLGMVAATLPVQWLMPVVGWRPLFWMLAITVVLAMVVIALQVPSQHRQSGDSNAPVDRPAGYAEVWRNPYFRRMGPIGFFNYGGLIAIQTLWAVPWMVKVAGYTPVEAATGLFWINVAMLTTFWAWGWVNPKLARRGINTDRLIAFGQPWSLLAGAILVIAAESFSNWAGVLIGLFCVTSTFVSLAQPAVGMAFAPTLAGRALSAYNLVIFLGVFVTQWGIGLAIDGFKALGFGEIAAFQLAFAGFLVCATASYAYFLLAKSHNHGH